MESSAERPRRPARSKEPEAPVGPQPCNVCRATGKVFAMRGEELVPVDCPWCQGSGTWEPGHDAQAAGVHSAA